ncbi:hypothetical protein F5X99DRAFT_11983 [Biscogniauxia marginata]|nr:hypothetical protein F5X99DRAFT_11983 [Biscogniauxia marginata]
MSSLRPLRSLRAGSSSLSPLVWSRLRPSSGPFFPLRPGSHQRKRAFHTPAILSTIVQGTPDLLVSIHAATHTPWFLTIPLIALGVNLVFRLPFSVYSQKILQRRGRCNTVLQAWSSRIQLDVRREGVAPVRREQEVRSRFEKARTRLYRTLGLQSWRLWSSIPGLPFWILAIDAVRRLCGGPRGLLASLVLGPGNVDSRGSSTTVEGSPEAASSSTAGDSIVDASAVDPSTASVGQVLDPSLITEGCLWFPDLTVADPYHVLPFLLSAFLVANILPRSRDGIRDLFGLEPAAKKRTSLSLPEQKITRRQRGYLALRRGLLLAGALVGPATVDLPAALHLYWLSSSAANLALVAILNRLMPLKLPSVEICKGVEVPIIKPQRDQREAPSKRRLQQQKTGKDTK